MGALVPFFSRAPGNASTVEDRILSDTVLIDEDMASERARTGLCHGVRRFMAVLHEQGQEQVEGKGQEGSLDAGACYVVKRRGQN